MDKILFIIPPHIDYNSYVNPKQSERTKKKESGLYGSILAEVPIGIISMSAYVKKYIDVETKLIDFNVLLNKKKTFEYHSFVDYFKEVFYKDNFNPNVICISTLFTTAYHNMLYISSLCKTYYPDAYVLAGGGVPTNMYNQIFEDMYPANYFDGICYGEGEKPLLEFIQAKNKYKYLEESNSWITRNKKDRNNFEFNFIENLDEIPFYDYDLCNLEDYNSDSLKSLFPLMEKDKTSVSYMTTRGCIHKCCFCSSHTVHGRIVRYHSVKRIKEDLVKLKEKYNVGIITFLDDHFMAKKSRVYEIIDIMKDLDLLAFFPSSLTLYALDRKMLEALQSVGMNHVILSMESGSERVLRDIIHKPLNLKIIQRVISDCRNLGIATDVSIMMGLPGETKQDIEDARQFFKTIFPSWYRFSVATPLVGSEMYNICIEKNYIQKNYLTSDYKTAVVNTEDFTANWIQEKLYEMNLEFNFVENNDMKLGNYSDALREFENVMRVKNDHAFAYYYASICCLQLDKMNKHFEYREKYESIVKISNFWKNYAKKFKLMSI